MTNSGQDLGAQADHRHHADFVSRASLQLAELNGLLADGGSEVLTSVERQLDWLEQSAERLGLDDVADGARGSKGALLEGPGPLALAPLAKALRGRVRTNFAPIGFVADAQLGDSLNQVAPTTAEPLVLLDSVEGFADPLRLQPWLALVVPMGDVPRAVALSEGAPVIAMGSSLGVQERIDALAAGASGIVTTPSPVGDLLFHIRRLIRTKRTRPEVFLMGADDARKNQLAGELERLGWKAVLGSRPDDLLMALEQILPDAIVLDVADEQSSEVSTAGLIRVVRAHEHRGDVPILVWTQRPDVTELWEAGADEVVEYDVGYAHVAQRIEQRRLGEQRVQRYRSTGSGLVERAEGLSQLDRQVRASQRTGQLLSCMLVEVEGLEGVRERWGKAAAVAAHRILGTGLDEGLRQTDLLVHLNDNTFLTLLPGCHQTLARRRGEMLVARMRQMLQRDHRLQGLACRLGVADNERGPLWLAKRADEDLRSTGVGEA